MCIRLSYIRHATPSLLLFIHLYFRFDCTAEHLGGAGNAGGPWLDTSSPNAAGDAWLLDVKTNGGMYYVLLNRLIDCPAGFGLKLEWWCPPPPPHNGGTWGALHQHHIPSSLQPTCQYVLTCATPIICHHRRHCATLREHERLSEGSRQQPVEARPHSKSIFSRGGWISSEESKDRSVELAGDTLHIATTTTTPPRTAFPTLLPLLSL